MTGAVDTRWFQGRLADRRMSQRKLASLMGLDPGAVSLALRGKRKLKANEVAEIARLLGAPVSEVMVHLGVDGHQGVKSGVVADKPAPQQPPAPSAEFEAEFMAKWVALGLSLLRNRGV